MADSRTPEDGEKDPTFREAFAAAAQRSRLSGVTPGEAPSGSALLGAVGGIRGLIETILPGLAFLVIYTITKELVWAVLAPFAVAIVFFVLGFVINGIAVVALTISLLVRRPLVGVVISLLTGDEFWRHDPAKLRIAYVTTVLWLLLSALRLAVQLPLYLAGLPDALAATKLLMGVPLYLGLLWATWMLVRTAWRPADEAGDGDSSGV
jgi:hypothetical protein